MRNIKRAGVLMAAALSAVVIIGASPSGAQEDLDCGDPGTFHNMPVDPNNDPNDLDSDGNGVGCEDPSAFGDQPASPPAAAPDPTPAPAPEPAAPAADLDCGDPGTSLNMPVDPNNDPNRLDADGDGVGCEDPSAFGDQPAASQAEPAVPQPGEPTFTG